MMHPQTRSNWVRLGQYWIFLVALSLVPVVLVFSSLPAKGVVAKTLSFTGLLIGLIVLGMLFIPPAKRRARDRRLVAAALAGQSPVDGARTAILGKIGADEPLRSPIADQPCVAFSYHIFEHKGSADRRELDHDVVKGVTYRTYYCSGYHLASPTIDTKESSFKVLGFPLVHGATRIDAKAYGTQDRRATTLRESTRFESSKLRDAMKQLREESSGRISRDWRIRALPDESDDLSHSESLLPVDAEVCGIGTYDAARGGLVAGRNHGDEIRIIVGDGNRALSVLGVGSLLRFWE